MAKKSNQSIIVLVAAIIASAAVIYLSRPAAETADDQSPLAMLEEGETNPKFPAGQRALLRRAPAELPPLSESMAPQENGEPSGAGFIGERRAGNPYTKEALTSALRAMLPPAPEGIEPLSSEHFAWAKAQGSREYAKQAVKTEPAPQSAAQVESSKPNPYRGLSTQGGVLALIPPDVGLEAKNQEELLQAYRRHKVADYSAKTAR